MIKSSLGISVRALKRVKIEQAKNHSYSHSNHHQFTLGTLPNAHSITTP